MLRQMCLVLLFTLGSVALNAAEPAPDTEAEAAATSDTDATASADADTDNTDADEEEAAGSLDGEGFVPSVQISEDLSVSFPTDI